MESNLEGIFIRVLVTEMILKIGVCKVSNDRKAIGAMSSS